MKRLRSLPFIAALLLLFVLATAACGGGDDNGDGGGNGAPTTVSTPADNGDNGDNDDDGDDGDGELTLVSLNTLYDKSELHASAGEVTITHDNQDGGILHNVHVYLGSDATGEDMGATELEAGPAEQTLTLNLEPGEYYYVCDAHPATMFGTLIVE
jgi:plastocyanin